MLTGQFPADLPVQSVKVMKHNGFCPSHLCSNTAYDSASGMRLLLKLSLNLYKKESKSPLLKPWFGWKPGTTARWWKVMCGCVCVCVLRGYKPCRLLPLAPTAACLLWILFLVRWQQKKQIPRLLLAVISCVTNISLMVRVKACGIIKKSSWT